MSLHASASEQTFGALLRSWRRRSRFSQLALALEAGLSQRHISFLETGRSRPSRVAIRLIGDALQMPAAEIDSLLVAAGFAPRTHSDRRNGAAVEAIEKALSHILAGHEPYPAIVIDRVWNLQKANRAAQAFFARFPGSADTNVLRAILRPGPLRAAIVNWPATARALMRLVELEAARRPSDNEIQRVVAELTTLDGVQAALKMPAQGEPPAVLALEMDLDGRRMHLVSLIATIGMNADARIDDIRVETLLPANRETADWFENHAQYLPESD